uniref:ATP synthase subunit a n=1 Tax=Paralongidorus litoralis TaxID=474435 RepID=A0A1P8C792_9BILA|nr:ATP synthase F0 subunit 6 [Paralongidorus litoralis]AOT84246.1 ATP synthase F0 subunit 6 [Paralongidorus litoralis]
MTTLFNLFCPLVMGLSLFSSIYTMLIFTVVVTIILLMSFTYIWSLDKADLFLYPNTLWTFTLCWFLLVMLLNLISMVCYSFPVTTTLMLNLLVAVSLWSSSVMILLIKHQSVSSFLPKNSPWYLAPFLSIVEAVSISIRPVTLCFRLLANMSAGHILLSLICKVDYVWLMGLPFGLLELMVCMVQSFVFLMLILVYLEEGLYH